MTRQDCKKLNGDQDSIVNYGLFWYFRPWKQGKNNVHGSLVAYLSHGTLSRTEQ